ncbi:LuxR C-terminal-related transcriptional regulator [Streptomyces sp. NPDC020965]|uniref:LuxR C-terminal-related transcriptional regulator n=1 Tax=Streptomyces sp. NPDC020965 TaxID=3365105 RepID=UPI0037A55898
MSPRSPTPDRDAGPAPGRAGLPERAPESARLRDTAREVADGASATVVVHGRRGTGRSTVLAEAAAAAREAGLHVVALRCRPGDRDRRHGVARDALTAAAGAAPGVPLAILVDDAPWADPRSVRAAAALARRSAPRPLLLIVAGHDPSVLPQGPSRRDDVALRPLSRDGVRELLAEAYGEHSCGPLVPVAVAATGGSPALLRSTIRRCPAPAPSPDELEAVAEQVGREQTRRALAPLSETVLALVRASAVGRGDLSWEQVYELAVPPKEETEDHPLHRTGGIGGPPGVDARHGADFGERPAGALAESDPPRTHRAAPPAGGGRADGVYGGPLYPGGALRRCADEPPGRRPDGVPGQPRTVESGTPVPVPTTHLHGRTPEVPGAPGAPADGPQPTRDRSGRSVPWATAAARAPEPDGPPPRWTRRPRHDRPGDPETPRHERAEPPCAEPPGRPHTDPPEETLPHQPAPTVPPGNPAPDRASPPVHSRPPDRLPAEPSREDALRDRERSPARARAELARAELTGTGLLDDLEHPRPYDALVADRVLALMEPGRRRELYTRAVRVGWRDGLGTSALARLVSHTELTEPWVPQVLRTAGRHARCSGDQARAIVFLERALDRGATGALRVEILLELALAQMYVRPEAADRRLRQVLAETADPGLSGARLFAADLLALRGGGRAAAQALADADGRESAPPGERLTLRALGNLLTHDPSTVDDTTDPGPSADPARAAAAAWRLCAAGREIQEARHLASAALAPGGLFAPRLTAVRVLAVVEDLDAANDGLDRIEADARLRGVRPALGLALLTRAELALRSGELPQARAWLTETLAEVPRRHWHPRTLQRLTAVAMLIHLESGMVGRAAAVLATAAADRHEYGLGHAELLFARGALDLHTGRHGDATAHLRECGRLLTSAGCLNPAIVPWRAHLGMAQAAQCPEAAAELLADDLAAARAWGAPGAVGAVHLCAGLTLTGPTALRHLRSAVRVLANSSARSRYARAMVELAATLLAEGRPGDGDRLLGEALETMRADGGRPTPRAEDVARRYAELARYAESRLTTAQLRVARLAADGHANQAIAQTLSISRRTVELHLTKSYRALGISGRADLPAALGHGGHRPAGSD